MAKRLFLLVALLLICRSTTTLGTSNPVYDGKWWLSVDPKQRQGFADGYISCFGFDVRNKIKFEYTGQMYAPRVTGYLLSHPSEQGRTVEELLWTVTPYAPPARRNAGSSSGAPTQSKYGIYDGEFWREISGLSRIGFVQGFLSCYSKYGRAANGTFTKPVAEYVDAISRWYEVDDEGGINLKKLSAKIPEVLFKFRDEVTH
jgi:hypothetical protein